MSHFLAVYLPQPEMTDGGRFHGFFLFRCVAYHDLSNVCVWLPSDLPHLNKIVWR